MTAGHGRTPEQEEANARIGAILWAGFALLLLAGAIGGML